MGKYILVTLKYQNWIGTKIIAVVSIIVYFYLAKEYMAKSFTYMYIYTHMCICVLVCPAMQ